MDQWSGALAALIEDPSSMFSINVEAPNHHSSSRGFDVLFLASLGTGHAHVVHELHVGKRTIHIEQK